MEAPLDVVIEKCPRCGAVNLLLAFVCGNAGKGEPDGIKALRPVGVAHEIIRGESMV